MIIGLNCGHTLPDGGSQGAVGFINESTENRRVGKALTEILENNGHTVVDCTNDVASDVNANLRQIVNMANGEPIELFVSIHFNAGGGKGVECYTYSDKSSVYGTSKKITENISKLGFANRGAKIRPSLYVLKNTRAPALLVEVCFVDTKSDVDLYRKVGAEQIAYAIAQAIDENIVIKDIASTELTEVDEIVQAFVLLHSDFK